MEHKMIRLLCYFRKVLNNAEDIDVAVRDLAERFPAYYDFIIDYYVLVCERRNDTYKEQRRKYKYDTEFSKSNKKNNNQSALLNKLRQNYSIICEG